ncbi:MAG TPA: TonB-dependent receptor [Candidatus Acidoferrales bacterium]|nr:TonB-dependent receptor [Candidatus Acidoferrales bacterium]
MKRAWLVSLLLVLASAAPARAQVEGGTIGGTVTDASGGVVPGAEVTIQNTATGVARVATTNQAGAYLVPNLVPGPYQLTAAAVGFQSRVVPNLVLTVGSQQTVDFVLTVGSQSQKVVVTGAVPAIQTANATMSGVVQSGTIVNLPLNGRDWTSLATLEPGVSRILTQPSSEVTNSTRLNRGLGAQMTIGGNRPQQNNYLVDGISINDYANAAPGSVLGVDLGVDSIQEFSVITSNAPAAYGKSSGGIINAETRSGSNALHGAAYEYLRNSALDTRSFSDGPEVPPFRRNQFGGAAGGPVVKNHTFVFGDYEGVRQALGVTTTIFTPSAAARAGTLTCTVSPTCPAGTTKVKVDPRVAPYLPLWPLPNGPVNGDTGQFSFVSNQVTNEDYFTSRVDEDLSAKDLLHGTYLFDTGSGKGPDNTDNLVIGTTSRRQLATIEESHIFSSSFLNSVRLGYSRAVADAPKTFSVINPLATNTSLGFLPGAFPGQIAVTGIETFQGGPTGLGEFIYHYNSYQLYDDAYYTRGNHAFQLGAYFERIQSNELGSSHALGQFKFGSLGNFLTDAPTNFDSALSTSISPRSIRQSIVGVYGEDNWRLRPNLTLNLGLRYEMSTVPAEAQNKLSTLPTPTSPAPRTGSPYFSNPTLLNFEPRIGLAWDPTRDGKTAVRAAFGIYDVLPLPYLFELPTMLSAPFYQEGLATKLPKGSFPTGAVALLAGLREAFIQPNPSRNYVMQWNLDAQRQLAPTVSLDIGYIGSEAVHQPFQAPDMNLVLPALTSQGYLWPTPAGTGHVINPPVGAIAGLLWQGTSSYNALEAKLTKQVSRGLQLQGSYTYAKNLDTSSSAVAGSTFDNSQTELPYFNPKLSRAASDFDVRQNLVVNYLWRIPNAPASFGMAAWPLRGWTWGGILQARTGVPFTPLIGGDPLGLNSSLSFDYPDRLSGPGCGSAVNPGSVHYIKTQCFAFPSPATRLGNAGRNSLVGPGLVNVDTTLIKDNPVRRVSENFEVQFQAEFFNVFNHTNFAPPEGAQTDLFNQSGKALASAGTITSIVSSSRQIQFGLKLIW